MNTSDNSTVSIKSAEILDSQPELSQPNGVDPFDATRLRLSQNFVAAAGVKKLLNTVPVRRPSKEWFIRTHPDEAFRIDTYTIELREEGEIYLVDQPLWESVASESTFHPRSLVTTINKQGVIFLWPIRLPGADGRIDDWNRTALEASSIASKSWIRVQANRSLGSYELYEARADWGEPTWELPSFNEVLRIAFRDRFIQTEDHPVLRRLRGEA